MFRLLKLKPPNGWNAVGWELLIVAAGVLLALGAQQAVETVTQQRAAAQTRATLTNEIKETLAILELRRAAQSCIDRRLKEVRALVDEWGRTGSFKTPSWVSQATWFAIVTARFDAAESAGRLALLPSEEQYRMGQVVGNLRNFGEIQSKEIETWGTLRMLQSGADALSASDRTAVRVALQNASTLNYLANIRVGQTLEQAASYGWHTDIRRLRQSMRLAWKDGRFSPTICLSIDTPPEQANRETNMIYPLPE
jgi:hypothetical protein